MAGRGLEKRCGAVPMDGMVVLPSLGTGKESTCIKAIALRLPLPAGRQARSAQP